MISPLNIPWRLYLFYFVGCGCCWRHSLRYGMVVTMYTSPPPSKAIQTRSTFIWYRNLRNREHEYGLCFQSMLLLNDIFESTWGDIVKTRGYNRPQTGETIFYYHIRKDSLFGATYNPLGIYLPPQSSGLLRSQQCARSSPICSSWLSATGIQTYGLSLDGKCYCFHLLTRLIVFRA